MQRSAMTATAEADVQEFEEQRPLLFAIAYRMLGSATDAEDIVQDAYLRYQAVPRDEIRNERSYLVTIVSRLCLDYLKSARVQRESYIGPWLPEPILTNDSDWRIAPEGLVDLRESVSMAFLVLLESLGPVERAVLLLHDVFDYSHAEVAQVVGRSEAGCRQLLKRARERVAERRPRHVPSLDDQTRLTQQFVSAAATGDVQGLIAVLAEDAIAYSDGGGKVAAALNPIYGADRVLRFGMGGLRKQMIDRIEVREVNGQPALLTWARDHLANIIFLQRDEAGKISRLYIQRNPDKLRRLRREMTAESGAASH